MAAAQLSIEDLTPGRRFVSGSTTVTADQIKRFATAYDPQPFHTDESAARDTFFGGLAASGWHTAALTMRLIVESLPVEGGLIGGGGEIVWPKPVRPGDTLQVESEILSVTPSRSKPGRAAAVVRFLTTNQNGEVVQSFTPKLLLVGRN